MLAAFRVANFRSFGTEAELALRAHKADKSLPSCLLKPGGNVTLLPAAAIYGPNAAGKTNVLAALRYMRRSVLYSQTRFDATEGTQVEPHLNKSNLPTELEVEFFIDRRRYVYGFRATPERYLEEWLFGFPKGRRATIFERRTDEEDVTGLIFGSTLRGDEKFVDSTIKRVRPNSLFLSAAAQDNNEICLRIQKFFRSMLDSSLIQNVDKSRSDLTSTLATEIPVVKDLVLSLIQSADSAVEDIEVEAIGGQGWREYRESEQTGFFRKDAPSRYKVTFVYGKTKRRKFTVPFHEQSKGIRKLYANAGEIASCFIRRQILVYDEIESSIHPHMARFIVDLFQDSSVNRLGSQLIFTTHDTGLLDQSLLRRDQIWFVEKERLNSKLYSLLDYSPRKDADLESGYLRGRYGAIPVARPRSAWIVEGSPVAQVGVEDDA